MAAVIEHLLDPGSSLRYHRKLAAVHGDTCVVCNNVLVTQPVNFAARTYLPCSNCEQGRAFAADLLELGGIPEDTERASGDMTCSVCQLEYWRHPSHSQLPTLHRICVGHWPREGMPDLVWVKT
jgi:hypothetical protein